jgi:hypothetical protein
LKVFTFKDKKEEAYSLVNTMTSMKYRYATGHYGKIKLWDYNSEVTTIHLNKTAKYDLIYAEKSKSLLCLSNSKKIEIVNLDQGKVILSVNLEFTLNTSTIIVDSSKEFSTFTGPYLNYLDFQYDFPKEPKHVLHSSLLDPKCDYAYMSIILFIKTLKYLVTLNNEGNLFLFFLSKEFKWKLYKRQNNTIDNRRNTAPLKNSNFLENKNNYNFQFNQKSENDRVYSLVELGDNYLGQEMYDRTLRIITLPDLEYYKTVKLPTGAKILNLGPDLGEDILFNLDINNKTCNFIFPFYETKYEMKSVISAKFPVSIINKEKFQRICQGRDTILIFTQFNVYQISVL